jgi:hypothetical protein
VPPGTLDVASWTDRPDTLLDPSLIPVATRRMVQRPGRRWLLAVPLLVVVGIAGLLWWRTTGGEQSEPPVPPGPARVAAPTTRPAVVAHAGSPDGGRRTDVGGQPDTGPVTHAHRPRPTHRARHASLHIVTSADERPIWAEILVDGRPVGKSPVSIPRLQPGSHRVTARREGFRVESRRVRLHRGQRRVLMVKLRRTGGEGR